MERPTGWAQGILRLFNVYRDEIRTHGKMICVKGQELNLNGSLTEARVIGNFEPKCD